MREAADQGHGQSGAKLLKLGGRSGPLTRMTRNLGANRAVAVLTLCYAGLSGGDEVLHLRCLADWSFRCRLRRARTATGSAAYAVAASSPVASRVSSSHPGIPVTGARMSAIGLRDRFADGRADGVAAGSVRLADARARAALPAAAVAVPVTVVDGCDVAAAVGPLAPEAGFAVALTCVIRDPVDVAGPLGAAAVVGETARLEAVGLDGAAEADAGLAAGAVD
jgi:hypothetical protein